MSKRLELAKKAWDDVKEYHPLVRAEQNRIVSEITGEQIELNPAEIKFGWLLHLLKGDYSAYALRCTNTIVIDGCYQRDWQNIPKRKAFKTKAAPTLSFPDYVLDRVAEAEGVRTSNHFYGGYMHDCDYSGMAIVGKWLAHESLKAINHPRMPLEIEVEAVMSKKEKMADNIMCPSRAYCRVEKARKLGLTTKS